MAEQTSLTKAELAYINKLVSPSGTDAAEIRSGFRIDGGPTANGLLMQLGAQATLSLQAELQDYSLTFPLRLSEDEFHSVSLQLAPPIIYERGAVKRAWRLHLEEPLPLLREDGGKSPLSVHELSPNGLLVDAGHSHKAPKHFHLRLALPGEPAMTIDARRIRETKGGMTAYEVEFPENEDAERVRDFLYQQHQRLHPEQQPEQQASTET